MEIAVRYGYAGSIGSLVWALTKRQVTGRGRLTHGSRPQVTDGVHLTGGKMTIPSAWRDGRASDCTAVVQHFYC